MMLALDLAAFLGQRMNYNGLLCKKHGTDQTRSHQATQQRRNARRKTMDVILVQTGGRSPAD